MVWGRKCDRSEDVNPTVTSLPAIEGGGQLLDNDVVIVSGLAAADCLGHEAGRDLEGSGDRARRSGAGAEGEIGLK